MTSAMRKFVLVLLFAALVVKAETDDATIANDVANAKTKTGRKLAD